MTARELYEYLLERDAEDLPLMIPHDDGHEFLTDMDIDIYIDAVLID